MPHLPSRPAESEQPCLLLRHHFGMTGATRCWSPTAVGWPPPPLAAAVAVAAAVAAASAAEAPSCWPPPLAVASPGLGLLWAAAALGSRSGGQVAEPPASSCSGASSWPGREAAPVDPETENLGRQATGRSWAPLPPPG